jgi:hypothetical protein
MRFLVDLPGVVSCMAEVRAWAGANPTQRNLKTVETGGAAPSRPNLDWLFEEKP